MRRGIWQRVVVATVLAGAIASVLSAQQPAFAQGSGAAGPAPDTVLFNGKIITVDDRFSITQAVAIRAERVSAVGTSEEITKLAGPNTRRIDLRGRTVTPGFIDNHAHYMEEGVLWSVELRLDGIETRKQAIEMIRAKATSLAPGEWVYTLGGWSPDQFTDDKRPFTRAELDAIVSDRPVLLQFTRSETYLNSRAVEAIGPHTTLENSFDGFLDQIERINKEFPVRNLRWSLIHGEQLTSAHLERMRNLGIHAAIQPRATIMGAIFNRVHGDRSYDMPPLRTIQESGVAWGFGTDTFEVNQYRPFTTLYFAVTGKMVGGAVVNRQPISREHALIAHTKGSAFTILQEGNMGSIQPGKLADLVVLDRDYLTIPAEQIKDIRPVMTMVGGRVVHDTTSTR